MALSCFIRSDYQIAAKPLTLIAFWGVAFFALLAAPTQAAPRHPPRGESPPPQARAHPAKPHHAPNHPAPAETPQLTSPAAADAGTAAQDLASSGQVDPLTGLGLRNPVCDQLGQIRDRQTRLACEANGTPEGEYPASNYGFDIFVSTGLTHPIGDLQYGFATVLNGIWLGLLFVLKLVLELLGLAFGLNPFASGPTMSRITAAIDRLYAEITDPWLSALIVCAGIWFAYKGLLRRELAGALAGTLAGVAMLIAGLWVIHQPRESVGRLAGLADEAALGIVSAPQSGSLARPAGSYAEAMSRTWSRLVEVPFAGLDFSDLRWALGKPPPEAVQKADEKFCQDFGALAMLAVLSNFGDQQAKEACAAFARKRYGRPRRVIDLYLRSSPNSPAREALWNYFNGDERYKAKVAAQGGDGVLTRLSMLALFALGLLGAILLLAWLAIRLFTQAAIAFALLLAAPFALFFPLLGDSGRRAFKTWGLTLAGATLAKVIYAAFLAVVLLGISILGQVDSAAGSATGFLLSAAFSWAVFLKRAQLVDWISIGEADRHAGHGLAPAGIAAFALARRMSQGGGRTLAGAGRRGRNWRALRKAERGEATRATANEGLHGRARALAETRHREAHRTVAEFEARHGRPTQRTRTRRDVTGEGEPAKVASSEQERSRYERARELVDRVEGNQRRRGQRFTERELERYGAEDRELLRTSGNPVDHAHRAGYERAQFEALRGPERERAEAAIEKATKRDRQRLEVASSVPGRIAGRRRQALEDLRQRREGNGAERREHLRRLRRDRRAAQLPARRNLSRGA